MTKNFGVQIILNEFTKALLLEFAYRELDNVFLKGKEITVALLNQFERDSNE